MVFVLRLECLVLVSVVLICCFSIRICSLFSHFSLDDLLKEFSMVILFYIGFTMEMWPCDFGVFLFSEL